MQLKNYMEELVWEGLDRVLATKDDICKCDKCRYDIAAITLNTLPPRYFVTDIGETFSRIKTLEQQFHADVTAALVNAIIIVKSRPHHN
jgi:competence protein ComFB